MLVVEDERLILMTIADELRDAGFTVFEANNADHAVKLLETHPEIGVLFTDIDMPGSMDGLRLSAAVRKKWPPIKIIITSGKHRPDNSAIPEQSLFVAKPYVTAQIVAAIHNFSSSH